MGSGINLLLMRSVVERCEILLWALVVVTVTIVSVL